jgi:hypothetical protein
MPADYLSRTVMEALRMSADKTKHRPLVHDNEKHLERRTYSKYLQTKILKFS